jgi:sterol desaturase/sphingolipid hydroxylase (fatty acid hydroxylase superfamily)
MHTTDLAPGLLRTVLETNTGPWMVAAIAILITLEGLASLAVGRGFDLKEEAASWGVGIGYFAVNVVGAKLLTLGLYLYAYEHHRLFDWTLASPWTWVAMLVAGDFVYYWMHRFEHEIRFFWAAHENHHSALRYTFGTAIRMPWGEILYHPIIGLWAPLLGFHPVMYPVMGTFNLLMGLLQHTDLVRRLGPLEWVFATPSHHRVHHGGDLLYLDRNYGARFIVWDRMFGTFQREEGQPTYGLTKNLGTHNPFRIVVHGYASLFADVRRAPRVADKLRYLVKPPGWSHDGPDQSSRARRASLAAAAVPAE